MLPGVTSTDTDLRVRVGLDKTPTGGGAYITVRPRVLDSGDGYYVDTRFLADQTLTVTLGRTVGGADDALETIVVPGIEVSEGDKLAVRVQAVGDTDTVLRAKIWRAGGRRTRQLDCLGHRLHRVTAADRRRSVSART